MKMTLGEIAAAVKGELRGGDPSKEVRGVSTDSRTLCPGEVFFALKGPRFDGHQFLEEVQQKGGAGAVVEREVEVAMPLIMVSSTLYALGDLAAYWRGRFKGKVIGVTGSCGKTTTRELIAHLLSASGLKVSSSPKNFNNHIGLPLSILSAFPADDAVVLEMGMSGPGEIAYLSRIARPDVGVITNVGPVHLEAFPEGIKGIQKAKGEILEGMGAGSVLIYNDDDPLVEGIASGFQGEKVPFGTSQRALVRGEEVQFSPQGTAFHLETPWGRARVRTKLLAGGGLYCALAASAVGLWLGLEVERVAEALEVFEPPPMRMRWRTVMGVRLLEDAYNSNPLALKNALWALALAEGRKIAVLGDMAELGCWAEEYHREAGRWCAECGVWALFLLGHWGWAIAEGAMEKGFKGPIFFCRDHEELVHSLRDLLREGDVVLVKGSRSMKMERVIELLEGGLCSTNSCTP